MMAAANGVLKHGFSTLEMIADVVGTIAHAKRHRGCRCSDIKFFRFALFEKHGTRAPLNPYDANFLPGKRNDISLYESMSCLPEVLVDQIGDDQ